MTRTAQRLDALSRAQDNRLARVDLLKRMAAGEVNASHLVIHPPRELYSMFVFDFLREVPRVGLRTIRELNRLAIREGVNLAVTMEELPPSRRQWLANWLAGREQRRVKNLHSGRRVPSALASRPQG